MQSWHQFSRLFLFLIAAGTLGLSGCNKEEFDPNKTGALTLEFDARAGSSDLAMGATYTNASGEDFTVSKFQYYVSNIVLTTADGSTYRVPTSATSGYYLVSESGTQDVILENIPENNYTRLQFMVGVDSLRNTMAPEKRAGDLDVGDMQTGGDMYWSWNSGYIFMKFEGVAAAVPDSTPGLWVQDANGNWSFDTNQYTYWNDIFNIHIGGYGGYDTPTPNNNRIITLDLPTDETLEMREGSTSAKIHLTVDILKIMDGSTTHSFTEYYQEHSPMRTGSIANNYLNMFSVMYVEN
ncbi:MAG: MbnP family protein [Bacteroidota bacterium]